MLTGACLCEAVRFEIEPPLRWFAHCHCSMCRKHHGTLFGTTIGIPEGRFRWLAGEDALVRYRASAAFERPFCGRCGSKAPALSQMPGEITVPAGALASLPGRPRSHIFVDSKSPLVEIRDELPQHAAYPPGIPPPVVQRPHRSTTAPLAGGCLCGAIVFAADVLPRRVVHCHCALCRRSRGTGFGSTLTVPSAAFRWIECSAPIRSYRANGYANDFCGRCGSPVPLRYPDEAAIPAGSIDTPWAAPSAIHTNVATKAGWDAITDDAPQFAAQPDGGSIPPHRDG